MVETGVPDGGPEVAEGDLRRTVLALEEPEEYGVAGVLGGSGIRHEGQSVTHQSVVVHPVEALQECVLLPLFGGWIFLSLIVLPAHRASLSAGDTSPDDSRQTSCTSHWTLTLHVTTM